MSGRIMRFPSAVPTSRILNNYEAIVSRGHPQKS